MEVEARPEALVTRHQCGFCPASYTTVYKLKYHQRVKHPEVELSPEDLVTRYHCNLCPSSYTRSENLTRHQRLNHPEVVASPKALVDREFQCAFCPTSFTRANNRNRHQRVKHPQETQRNNGLLLDRKRKPQHEANEPSPKKNRGVEAEYENVSDAQEPAGGIDTDEPSPKKNRGVEAEYENVSDAQEPTGGIDTDEPPIKKNQGVQTDYENMSPSEASTQLAMNFPWLSSQIGVTPGELLMAIILLAEERKANRKGERRPTTSLAEER